MALFTTIQRSTRSLPRLMAQAGKARGMATEKQILNKINASKNIQKITGSMKMVSAAKLKGDEKRLELAKPFNSWTDALCPEPVSLEETDLVTYEELPQKTLILPITSDKGLCGGVNSFVSRAVRDAVPKIIKQGKEVDIVVVGDKGRSQMARSVPDYIRRTVTECQAPGNFTLASAIAAEVAAVGKDYDAIMIVYNSYVNAAVYKQYYRIVKPLKGDGESEPMMEYEFEPETKAEILDDLSEYMLASQIYYCFMDGAAAEQSSRMTAMENATKNAGEMIDSLTLVYNRARQARITTELIEIISGAAALED